MAKRYYDGKLQDYTCAFKMCDGSGRIGGTDEKGRYSVTDCRCWWSEKVSHYFFRTVGEHDQWVALSDLKPSTESKLSEVAQQKCISVMQADPRGNYVMFGPSGVSKTTYTVALYRACLSANYTNYQNIIRIKTKTLLDTIQAWRYDEYFRMENAPPFTHAKKIRGLAKNGTRTHLFLEELEKVKYTENRASELFDIIDALYEEGGQLVISGNLTFTDLNDTNRFPEGFPRRIEALCGKHKWDFWKHATTTEEADTATAR